MKVKKQLIMVILVLLLVLLTSCKNPVIIHPIEQKDIFRLKAGEDFVPEVDGYFFSDYYVKEVIDAKVRK
jgi:hypothetical protein